MTCISVSTQSTSLVVGRDEGPAELLDVSLPLSAGPSLAASASPGTPLASLGVFSS